MSEIAIEEQTLHPVSLGTSIHDKKGFDETLSNNVDKDDDNIHEDGSSHDGCVDVARDGVVLHQGWFTKKEDSAKSR